MREWLVGSALIESPEGILLVQNRRRGGIVDWSPPGGVIDEGEELLTGLAREVEEETGLVVTEWHGPLYEIDATAPGLGWHLRVEVWSAAAFSGELAIGDPDGIVVDARFVPVEECCGLVQSNHPWVVEPLVEYLGRRWKGSRRFGYQVNGERLAELVVTRL
ncbi:MAG: NUDIX hydrolase [Acidimicrobiales bacterium]|nr:NUDIX hydrolase [Acidimicrobiales bacterium]